MLKKHLYLESAAAKFSTFRLESIKKLEHYRYKTKNRVLLIYLRIIQRPYTKTFAWAFIFILFTCLIGYALDYIDTTIGLSHWHILRDISSDAVFSYQAAIFAVMIPIYLLVMEQRVGIKSIGSRAILTYVQFREVALLLVITTITALIVSEAGWSTYLYIPLAFSTIFVLYALHRVFVVMFQTIPLKRIIAWMLNDTIDRHVFDLRLQRITRNKTYELLKKCQHLGYLHLRFNSRIESLSYEVSILNAGTITTIDVCRIETGLKKINFKIATDRIAVSQIKEGSLPNEDSAEDGPSVAFELHVLPYKEVRVGTIVGKLTVASGVDKATVHALIELIRSYIRVEETRGALFWLDDWLDDIEEMIYNVRSNQNIASLRRTLEWYQLILDEVDCAVAHHTRNDAYDFAAAESEYNSWSADPFGKELERLFEIIDDALRSAMINGSFDEAKELVHFVYHNVLADRAYNPTTTARTERWFSNMIGNCLYNQDKINDELCDYVISRYVEHTGLLLFQAKNRDHPKQNQSFDDLLLRRITDVRHSVLYSAKTGNKALFEKLSEPLTKNAFEAYTSRYRETFPEEIQKAIDNSLVLIVAYIRWKKLTDTEPYSSFVSSLIHTWQFEYLTERLIDCYDNELASRWRVDSIDLIADGKMHSVHDYTDELREIWVMSAKSHHVDGSVIARSLPADSLEQTLFFTGGVSSAKESPFYKLPGIESYDLSLKSAINTCCSVRLAHETRLLADAPIDQEKVKGFRVKAEAAYLDNSLMNRILPSKKRIIDKSSKQKGYKQYGIHTIFDKQAFVKEWHSGYIIDHNAEELGRQSASIEDTLVLDEIKRIRGEVVELNDALSRIRNDSKAWVAIAINTNQWQIRRRLPELIDVGSNGSDEWHIDGIDEPVKRIHTDKTKEQKILFIRPDTMGAIYYISNSEQYMDVEVTVLSDDENARELLIKEEPEWLKNKGDIDSRRTFLSTKVILKVMHIFRYESSDAELMLECLIDER